MHVQFNYKDSNELLQAAEGYNVKLPFSENTDLLFEPLMINDKTIPNKIAIQPMEGCDGETDGKPSEYTYRRYERFASGGAGLLWVEAVAVSPEGRANPRQLYICRENYEDFKKLHDLINANSKGAKPYQVLQLTHSGRYSRPGTKPEPIVAARNKYLDKEGSD